MATYTIKDTSVEFNQKVIAATSVAATSKNKSSIIQGFELALAYSQDVAKSIPPKVSHYAGTTRSLRVVTNLLSGVLDGLESGDLSLKELRSISSDIASNRIPAFLEVTSSEINAVEIKRNALKNDFLINDRRQPVLSSAALITNKLADALNEHADQKQSTSTVNPAFKLALEKAVSDLKLGSGTQVAEPWKGNSESPDMTKESIRKYFADLKTVRAGIPITAGKSGFTILRLPVAPVFQAVDSFAGSPSQGAGKGDRRQPNPAFALKSAGIKVIPVEEYVIIADQLMLAISKTELPPRPGAALVKKVRATVVPLMTPLEYAKYILAVIAENTGNRYELVNPVPVNNPRNKDMLFFWIMPANSLSYIVRKGFPNIHQWGLPF